MMRLFVACGLLAGCATPVPVAAVTCAPPLARPAPPPPVRTVERLLRYATDLELAREAERRRGDDCAAQLAAVQRGQ